jgi:hypothetical protein
MLIEIGNRDPWDGEREGRTERKGSYRVAGWMALPVFYR